MRLNTAAIAKARAPGAALVTIGLALFLLVQFTGGWWGLGEDQIELAAVLIAAVGWLTYLGARRATLRQLKLDESELHLLATQAPADVWTTDPDLRITSAFGALLARLENPPARIPGRTLYEVFGTRDDTHPAIAAHLRALRGESARYERTAGEVVVEGRVEPLRDRRGRVVGCVGAAIDVSTWRWAESQVRRFAALVQSSEDAITSTDLAGMVESWNAAAERLYGYSANEMLGCPISLLEPPDRAGEQAALRERLIRGEQPPAYETIRRRRDGTAIEISTRLSPIRDELGKLVGVSAVVRDITERRAAERQLQLLADALANASDMISVTDPDNRFVYVNEAFLRAYGYVRDEVLGQTPALVERSDDVRREILAGTMQGGWTGDIVNRRKDGTELPVSLTTTVIRDSEGGVIGLLGVARDISERRRAEQVRQRLVAIVESSEDAIISTGIDGTILTWNGAAERLYGFKAEEVVGKLMSVIVGPDRAGEVARNLSAINNGEVVKLYETERVTKDGTSVPVAVSVSPVRNAEGVVIGASAIVRDITERKRAEEERKEAEEHFRVLAEVSPDLIARFDTRLRHLYVNPAAAAAGKLSASEYVGLTIAESGVVEPFATTWTQRFGQVLKTGMTLDVENIFPTPEGVRYFHTRIVPELAPDGSVRSLLSFARDITELKRAGEEVARIASFPLLNPMPIVEVDAAGKISFMNPAAERLFPGLRAVSPDHPFVADAWTLVEERQGEGGGLRTREVEIGGRSYLQNVHALPDHSHVRIYASDITDRTRAEELRERLAAIVESSEDAIISIDLAGTIESWNPAAERLYGYRAQEVIGRPLEVLAPPERLAELQSNLEHTQRGHRLVPYETERVRRDGVSIAVSVTVWPIKDDTGSVLGMSGIHRDISARKQADDALRHLAAIVESSDDAIVSTDTARVIRTWNPSAERLYGYTAAEAVGKNFDTLILAPGAQPDLDAVAKRLALGAAVARYEGTRVRKDGSFVEVAGTASEMRDAWGVLTGYTSIIRDVSERKRMDEALRESETMFRLLAENATDVISRHAPDGTFLYVSPACRKLLGYEAQELVGRSPYDFVHPHDAAVTTPTGGALDIPEDYSVTFRFRRKDGTYGWFESLGHTVRDPATGTVTEIQAVSREVTDRMRVESQLRQQGEDLRALARHLDSVREEDHTRMAREIHDELAQSLTALRLDLSWLAKRVPAGGQAVREKLAEMAALTNATIEAGRRIAAELRPPILDDLGLIAALEWFVQDFAKRTKLRATLDVGPKELPLDGTLAVTAYRIVQEALANVARHAEAKRVTVRLGEQDGALVLEITDDGRGMHADASAKAQSFGIVGMRERVMAHGGALEIASSPGAGTTVRATIPLERRREPPEHE